MYNFQSPNHQHTGYNPALFDSNIPFLPSYGVRVIHKLDNFGGKCKVSWHIGGDLFAKLVIGCLADKPLAVNQPDLHQMSLVETALTNDIKNDTIFNIYVNDIKEFGKSCTFHLLSTSMTGNKLSIPGLSIGYVDKFTFYGDSMLAYTMLMRYSQNQPVSTLEGVVAYTEFKNRIELIKALATPSKVNPFDLSDKNQPGFTGNSNIKGNKEFNNFFDKMFDHPLFNDINSVTKKDDFKELLMEVPINKQLSFSKFSVAIPPQVGHNIAKDRFNFNLITSHGPVNGFISETKTNGYNLYETKYGLDYRFLKLTNGTNLEPGKIFVHFDNQFRPNQEDLKVIGNLFTRALVMYAKTQWLTVDAGITVNGVKRLVTKDNLTDDMSAVIFNAGEYKESINVSVTMNGKVYETKYPIQVMGEVRVPTEGCKFTIVPGYERFGFDLTKI